MSLRLSKAIKYYKLTEYMANLFSKDPSTKVGSLFMYPETLQILSMGYNDLYFIYIKIHFVYINNIMYPSKTFKNIKDKYFILANQNCIV